MSTAEEREYLLGSAALRLAPSDRIYQALMSGAAVPRHRLKREVLAAVAEPLEGDPLELDERFALRVEAALGKDTFEDGSEPPESKRPPRAETEGAAEHTWHRHNLLELVAQPPTPPTIGRLLYEGKRHVVSGEADAGKSWLLLAIAAWEILGGHGVLWVDTDGMGHGAVLERLRSLGLKDKAIGERFGYLQPEEPLDDASRADVLKQMEALKARLLAFDAFNSTLVLHECDPNSTEDVEQFLQRVVNPFAAKGAAVALPDHVPKDKEKRGRYSYGSERKVTGVDVHLGLTSVTPFGRGRTGKAKLIVHKDRVGFLERPSPGLFVLESNPDTGKCSWNLETESVTEEGLLRPTVLMERVSRHLEAEGEERSRSQIVEGVEGKAEFVRRAIDVLVSEGHAEKRAGARGARLVTLQRLYREESDPAREGES